MALEAYIADGLNREAALLFNSGFAPSALCMALFLTCLTLIKARVRAILLPTSSCTLRFRGAQCVSDSAKLRRFKHNDLSHLESLLSSVCQSQVPDAVGNSGANQQDTLIASEGVFSMDGDVAPCEDIAELAAKYNAWFMLDDAHGMGVSGENGFGTAEALNLSQQQAPIVMGTFGKAVGTAGAFIAGSQTLIDYLVNFLNIMVFHCHATSTSGSRRCTLLHISPVILPAAKRCITISPISETRFKNVLDRHSIQARKAMHQLKSLWGSQSAIQPIIVGSPERAVALSEGLKQRGIWATAIRQPTVPKNQDRLRITLTSNHTSQDIDVLLDALELSLNNFLLSETSVEKESDSAVDTPDSVSKDVTMSLSPAHKSCYVGRIEKSLRR